MCNNGGERKKSSENVGEEGPFYRGPQKVTVGGEKVQPRVPAGNRRQRTNSEMVQENREPGHGPACVRAGLGTQQRLPAGPRPGPARQASEAGMPPEPAGLVPAWASQPA